jgi:DNA-binding MarR family transcriptional regulator/N-acetylglutamate synthase-like GNAT family acetyltransferase
MSTPAIAQVRSFNRTVAEGIGALDDRFLGRARPLGEARLLWEVGADGADVRALRARLGLDSGYLSRLLRSLEHQRLVRVRTGAPDRRVRRVHLTKAGLAERKELDRRSDAVAQRMLDPLSETQRATFLAAVAEVERLLRASMVRFAVEKPASADAQWCVTEYFKELKTRFERGFDPALTLRADVHALTPPAGAFYIARLHGRPVGCGALKLHGREPAELKRMWIASDARGLGLGRRLLHELEQHARRAGASAVRLETNRALREAIALYRGTGYVEVDAFNAEPYAHHWFEKRF